MTLDQIQTATWAAPATEDEIERTADSLRGRGFEVIVVDTGDDARDAVLAMLPDGAEVHQGASVTLDTIGVTRTINDSGHFVAVRPRIFSMDRATQGAEIRRLSASPEFMVNSVAAVTETGSLIVASKTGSQLGPLSSGAGKVIVVAGSNKIVRDLEEGLRRVDEHALALENERSLKAYGMPSEVAKLLIVNREVFPGRTTLILVREALGY